MNGSTATDINKLENRKGYGLVDEVLKHQPSEFKQKVLLILQISGIHPDDPLFLVLLACRINQILLEAVPSELENSFAAGTSKFAADFEQCLEKLKNIQAENLQSNETYFQQLEKAALNISEGKINQAISRILDQNDLQRPGGISPKLKGMMLMGVAVIVSLLTGMAGGWGWAISDYSQREAVHLSRQDLNLLDWAKSKEGRVAQAIVGWNDDLVDRSCQRKVKNLGVTIQLGTAKATSGYCWIWTVPPNQRTFTP